MSSPGTLFEEYRWRGMLHDVTEGAEAAFEEAPQAAYVGFDPTASSLHVGHLLPIMGLVHLQRAGHTPIALVGGGTGLIGDPSGKSQERQLLTRAQSEENARAVRDQLAHFLDFQGVSNPAVLVDNLEWLGGMQVLDYLRDVGKHFSVNVMLRKDTVKRRIAEDGPGISYTEFSYLLLQSYDFLRLFQDRGCRFQFGGSDQWGNITGGTDLIRRVTGERAFGVTFPLITTSSGVKFGKTEAGAVWLDPKRTSPYRFYQFWLQTEDADVGRYLRYFTLLSRPEIEALEASAAERPEAREAQRALARDVTARVHGEHGLARAEAAAQALFGGGGAAGGAGAGAAAGGGGAASGGLEALSPDELVDLFRDVPSSTLPASLFEGDGIPVLELVSASTLVQSKGEARRGIEQGGLYLNNARLTDVGATVTREAALHGRFLLLRKGKRSYHLIQVEG
jgi:tyrosyl-tRNA synthetase